ncbi:hypothetical protein COOONC_23332 [Cooperia oncophora]
MVEFCQGFRKHAALTNAIWLSLAFVAYPEAMDKMPWPTLWGLMFFSMLFFLGVSSQAAGLRLHLDTGTVEGSTLVQLSTNFLAGLR